MKRKQVTTRREHLCRGCEKVIEKGDTAIVWTGKYDDASYRYHLHLECNKKLIKHAKLIAAPEVLVHTKCFIGDIDNALRALEKFNVMS